MNNLELQALASTQGITLDPTLLEDYPIGTWFWAIHHEVVAEPLTEPLANRIKFILTRKNASERKVRLAALRPVKNPGAIAPAQKAYSEATVAAGKACEEAIAAAGKAYEEATAPAGKAYEEAIAPAWKAYSEASAAAGKAYAESTAPARKICAAQWIAEYPDHPAWDKNGLVF